MLARMKGMASMISFKWAAFSAMLMMVACGSTTSTPPVSDGGRDGGTGDAGGATANTQCGNPSNPGNEKGIGKYCTHAGGQCSSPTMCDKDLDATRGFGMCVTILMCQRGRNDCGSGATCCNTPTTQNVPVCISNTCLPRDCTPEP